MAERASEAGGEAEWREGDGEPGWAMQGGDSPRFFCAVQLLTIGEGTDPHRLGTGPAARGKQALTEQRLAFQFFPFNVGLNGGELAGPSARKKDNQTCYILYCIYLYIQIIYIIVYIYIHV